MSNLVSSQYCVHSRLWQARRAGQVARARTSMGLDLRGAGHPPGWCGMLDTLSTLPRLLEVRHGIPGRSWGRGWGKAAPAAVRGQAARSTGSLSGQNQASHGQA